MNRRNFLRAATGCAVASSGIPIAFIDPSCIGPGQLTGLALAEAHQNTLHLQLDLLIHLNRIEYEPLTSLPMVAIKKNGKTVGVMRDLSRFVKEPV